MLLLIVIRIIVSVLLQSFYRKKFILKENERLLFQKYGILHCTKKLLMESYFCCELEENPTGILKKRKGPHDPQYSYDIIKVPFLMVYSNFIIYKLVGDTKTALLRCIPFISKKNGDIITTGQYMNYQSFTILQFKKFLKNSFHSITTELSETTGEKFHFVSVGIKRVVHFFRNISDNHF